MNCRYKQSLYNYVVDYKEGKLLFNGLRGTGLSMSISEWNTLEPLLNETDKFYAAYPSDFQLLKKLGMIVDESLDEVSLVKFMNRQRIYDTRMYQLMVNPTLECCFNCWYCYEDHPVGHMSNETITAVERHIRHKIVKEKIDMLQLSWFGGEPLLYYDNIVSPISRYAMELAIKHNVVFSNSITTNAYCIDCSMVEDMARIGLSHFQITIDGDKSRHDKIRNCKGQPSYDRIISNINNILECLDFAQITLRINYDNNTFTGELDDIVNSFPVRYHHRITFDLQRVWQTFDTINGEGQKRHLDCFIQNAINALYIQIVSKFKNYRCHTERLNFACINYDGGVFKCTARPFCETNRLGILRDDGRILWDMSKLSCIYSFSPMEGSCKECVYLPLCMGPCYQGLKESGYRISCHFKSIDRSPSERIVELYENTLKNN